MSAAMMVWWRVIVPAVIGALIGAVAGEVVFLSGWWPV